jgi:hypothetical protein
LPDDFISEYLVAEVGAEMTINDVFAAYKDWTRFNGRGLNQTILTKKDIVADIIKRYGEASIKYSIHGKAGFLIGYRRKEDDEA